MDLQTKSCEASGSLSCLISHPVYHSICRRYHISTLGIPCSKRLRAGPSCSSRTRRTSEIAEQVVMKRQLEVRFPGSDYVSLSSLKDPHSSIHSRSSPVHQDPAFRSPNNHFPLCPKPAKPILESISSTFRCAISLAQVFTFIWGALSVAPRMKVRREVVASRTASRGGDEAGCPRAFSLERCS